MCVCVVRCQQTPTLLMIQVRALATPRFMILRVVRREVYRMWKARRLPSATMCLLRFFFSRRIASKCSGMPRSCSF